MSYPGVDEEQIPDPQFTSGVKVADTPTGKQYGLGWDAPIEFDFETPRGTLCRLRKVDVEFAMELGLINHLDIFSGRLMKTPEGKTRTAEELEEAVLQKLSSTGESDNFFTVINRIVQHACVIPQLVTSQDELGPGKALLQNVKLQEKMAIFHAVFGEDMKKIEPFRDGQESSVGAVQRSESVGKSAKRSTRNPKGKN